MRNRALFMLFLALTFLGSSVRQHLLTDGSGSYDMLIVGPKMYESTMEGFIDLKMSQGVATRYLPIESIGTSLGESKTARRLHDLVATEHERAGIRYLLLIGTYDQVPTKYVYSPSYEHGLADYNYKPTDWYYGVPEWDDVEIGLLGGNLPEIAVGRLPVESKEELERTLEKITYVEENPRMSSFLVFGDLDVALESSLSGPCVYYSPGVNLTSKPLTQLLSGGAMHVISYSHGTPSALWTYGLDGKWSVLMSCENVSEINGTYGIQYIVACFTGALDLGNKSLARTLIASPKGPALVIASSRVEMSGPLISSKFWRELLGTGDVGGSMVEALRSYLLDPVIFPSGVYSFDYYNSYLDKVVYGDVSWTIRSAEGVPSAGSGFLVQSGPQDSVPRRIQSAEENTTSSGDLSAWLSLAVALSCHALLAGLHGMSHGNRTNATPPVRWVRLFACPSHGREENASSSSPARPIPPVGALLTLGFSSGRLPQADA